MNRVLKLRKIILAKKFIAMSVTAMFHPLLMPTYIFACVALFSPISLAPLHNQQGARFLISLIFLSTFLLPLLVLTLYLLLKKSNFSWNVFLMDKGKERVLPFTAIGAIYTFVIYKMKDAEIFNSFIITTLLIITAAILINALISQYWKISAHSTGMLGLITILMIVHYNSPDSTLFYPIIALLFFGGILLSSRLYLNAHTPGQIAGGAFLGIISGFVIHFIQ